MDKISEFVSSFDQMPEDEKVRLATLLKSVTNPFIGKPSQEKVDAAHLLLNFATRVLDEDVVPYSDSVQIISELRQAFKPPAKLDAHKIAFDKLYNNLQTTDLPKPKFRLSTLPTIAKASLGLMDGMYIWAADPNVGKTGILIHLAMDLLVSNPNAKVLFYSADDSATKLLKRMIAAHMFQTSQNWSPIKYVDTPYDKYDYREGRFTFEPKTVAQKAITYEWLKKAHRDGRFIVISDTLGLEAIEEKLLEMGDDTTLIVDAAYKIDIPTGKDDNDIDRKIAEGLKSIAVRHQIAVCCAKDARKGNTRGAGIKGDTGERRGSKIGLEDLRGSVRWGYEADFVCTMWREESEAYIKCSIVKNKIDNFAGAFTLQNWPEYNGYRETTEVTE